MATQMITQMIACYQLSCNSKEMWAKDASCFLGNHIEICILKWLWNDMKMNSSAGSQNVDAIRADILIKNSWVGYSG